MTGVFQIEGIDYPSWWDGNYGSASSTASLQALAATNAGMVSIPPTSYMSGDSSSAIFATKPAADILDPRTMPGHSGEGGATSVHDSAHAAAASDGHGGTSIALDPEGHGHAAAQAHVTMTGIQASSLHDGTNYFRH